MIDLRKKGLPSHIYVAGEPYLLDTDFRKWIDIGEKLDNPEPKIEDIAYVIKGITVLDLFMHRDEILKGIVDFYTNPNSTPRGTSSGNEVILDYIEDGEYIVGSFMQAYGIDLTSVDLHWHMFKALFISLPEDTKIKQIMQMRGYKKDNKSYERQSEELKRAWSLNKTITQDIDMSDINELFYNT